MSKLKLSNELASRLCCPRCRATLLHEDHRLRCTDKSCGQEYPIVEGIPVLINENNSLFSISDYQNGTSTTPEQRSGWQVKFLPTLNRNLAAERNYEMMGIALGKRSPEPKVLVIGGKILGSGIQSLYRFPQIEIVEMDVFVGPNVKIISDAHDIPFKNETFDGVVVQAVLEHVCDPYRCVDEIHRVLMPLGVVYAETPFMQQVHEGAYDYTRFTHLGHRRLFRKFKEMESGIACGPGMALAWAFRYFLLSFSASVFARNLLSVFARFSGFFWKYFDPYLAEKPGSFDCASGFFFMGEKSDEILSDRDLIAQYRGLMQESGNIFTGKTR